MTCAIICFTSVRGFAADARNWGAVCDCAENSDVEGLFLGRGRVLWHWAPKAAAYCLGGGGGGGGGRGGARGEELR